jgi:hypothetical protein
MTDVCIAFLSLWRACSTGWTSNNISIPASKKGIVRMNVYIYIYIYISYIYKYINMYIYVYICIYIPNSIMSL